MIKNMNTYIETKQNDFTKSIEFFEKEISSLRTGRANAAVLDSVVVESYGVKTQINALASISVPDGTSMLVSPWDKGVLKDIEKAIVEAGLGLGVVNEGDKIRLTVPRMTEENRRDLVKKLNEKFENARISFRKIRDEIKTSIEKAEKNTEITKDEKYSFIEELDEVIRKKNDDLKAIKDKKEKDIMTI